MKLNQKKIKNLENILQIQSIYENETKMYDHIIKRIKASKGNIKITQTQDYIIAEKGKQDLKPYFVSHIDTVHSIIPDKDYKVKKEIHSNDIIYSSDYGIGGDDKNGIFICLELLEMFNNIKVVFFSGEEIGCIGSSQIDLDLLNDCLYLIQLDRKGNSDIIDTYCCDETISKDFRNFLYPIANNYGYDQGSGTVTDVMTLFSRQIDISCVNLSCGYYNAHTTDEYISLKDLSLCLDLCKVIIE